MQKALTLACPLLAVAAWTLTVILVANLLGGVFDDDRSCRTGCFQILYWSALALAAVGFAGSIWRCMRGRCSLLLIISGVALLGLLGILLTTALIGSL